MKDFYSRLKDLMDKRGISQSDLARLLDVTPTAIWNWLHNGVQPRPDMAAKIARTFDVDVVWLMRGIGSGPSVSSESASNKTIAQGIADLTELVAKTNGVARDRVKVQISIVS